MSKHELTAQNVIAVMRDCLFKEGEPTEPHVRVEGITTAFGLHPERLESHRAEVAGWITQLPTQFLKSSGGGWSFLNLCNRADGEQWGEHPDMEALCVLAIGLKLAKFQLPREMWSVLPGGMPYVMFEDISAMETKA